jgi:L,D-transpeptidase catalytic domain
MLRRIIALVGLFVLGAGLAAGCGGAAPAAPTDSAGPSSAPVTSAPATPTLTPDQAAPSPRTPLTPAADSAAAPSSGQWIDVDVTNFTVSLMDGRTPVRTISPVAVGREIDTGVYNSTATGLFHVYSKTAALTYDAPYDTYIANWVGFDPNLDNGFHSFLEDANGEVVDASTGRVSNGCIRTGASAAIFAFAEIGMPVYVHT